MFPFLVLSKRPRFSFGQLTTHDKAMTMNISLSYEFYHCSERGGQNCPFGDVVNSAQSNIKHFPLSVCISVLLHKKWLPRWEIAITIQKNDFSPKIFKFLGQTSTFSPLAANWSLTDQCFQHKKGVSLVS